MSSQEKRAAMKSAISVTVCAVSRNSTTVTNESLILRWAVLKNIFQVWNNSCRHSWLWERKNVWGYNQGFAWLQTTRVQFRQKLYAQTKQEYADVGGTEVQIKPDLKDGNQFCLPSTARIFFSGSKTCGNHWCKLLVKVWGVKDQRLSFPHRTGSRCIFLNY